MGRAREAGRVSHRGSRLRRPAWHEERARWHPVVILDEAQHLSDGFPNVIKETKG